MQAEDVTGPGSPLSSEPGLPAQRVKRFRQARWLSLRQRGALTGTSSAAPHRIENSGDGRAEVQWIISPSTSGLTNLDRYTTGVLSKTRD